MTMTPFTPGQSTTSDMLLVPLIFQEDVPFGINANDIETTLATIVVPSLTLPTLQIPSVDINGNPSSAAAAISRWRLRLRDEDDTGYERGTDIQSRDAGAASDRFHFGVGMGEPREVPGGISATYVVTLQRIAGGADTMGVAGGTPRSLVSVLVLPDPASI